MVDQKSAFETVIFQQEMQSTKTTKKSKWLGYQQTGNFWKSGRQIEWVEERCRQGTAAQSMFGQELDQPNGTPEKTQEGMVRVRERGLKQD